MIDTRIEMRIMKNINILINHYWHGTLTTRNSMSIQFR